MLKYRIDKIVEGEPSTVYVNLYDEAAPETILTSLCVQYLTEKDFEAELQRKTEKYLASISAVQEIKPSVEAVIARLEGNMTTMQEAAKAQVQKGEISDVQEIQK
jgi:hypothetical protein